MYKVKIDDMILTVDKETAEQLTDPDYAEKYISAVKQELLKDTSKKEEKSKIWKSPKCPNEEDHKATLALLALRKSYDNEFCNKKTPKNEIWSKIAAKMNQTGFYVGEGIDAREKVRQKFWNLQSAYTKYIDAQKRTGEGSLRQPKYFDEMDEILGLKHKINPPLIIDTELKISDDTNSASLQMSEPCCSSSLKNIPGSSDVRKSCSSSSKESPTASRFEAVKKTVRPKSEKPENFSLTLCYL